MIYERKALFEVNARILLKRVGVNSLLAIPDNYWRELVLKGFNFVWLMGVWKVSESSVKKYCLVEHMITEYKNALPDWREEDVAGSPYAIEDYVINPVLGSSNKDLKLLKQKLNGFGLALILDFIPNHFNAESKLLESNPELFLRVPSSGAAHDSKTFFTLSSDKHDSFAHGKDPFYDAWEDTAQINYASLAAIDFMIGRLTQIADLCDGVRCDMAMLVLKEVFFDTWKNYLRPVTEQMPDFWTEAINSVKKLYPRFIFIAEAYWDLGWELQQQGFDFTYDKRLYDRLKGSNVGEIKDHLKAVPDYQKQSVRFIENHDEKRAVSVFGEMKSKAAAIVINTIPGLIFYHDGQMEGKSIKLPLQLNREPIETQSMELLQFYNHLAGVLNKYLKGDLEWLFLEAFPAWNENNSFSNVLLWNIKGDKFNLLVCVNYSDGDSQCRVKIPLITNKTELELTDLLNDKTYSRSVKEITGEGLYVDLKPYHGHVFLLNE